MRKLKKYSIRIEPIEDMLNARRFSPCLQITFRDNTGEYTHKIQAGRDDDIYVYQQGDQTFVLNKNKNLGYVGLEVFCNSEWVGNIFLNEFRFEEEFNGNEFSAITLIRRLSEYIL